MFHNYGHPEIMVTFLGYKGDSNSEVPLYLLINNMVFIYHYSIIYLNEFTTSRRFHNTLTKKILVELMATSEIISRTNDSLISNEILYANSNKWKLYITTTYWATDRQCVKRTKPSNVAALTQHFLITQRWPPGPSAKHPAVHFALSVPLETRKCISIGPVGPHRLGIERLSNS